MYEAENIFIERPFIHLNLIKRLHSTLLSGVRGKNKAMGEFRSVQVYIGKEGHGIEDAVFIPPEAQNVRPALDNWEKYVNNCTEEILTQCAIMHAQFEIIHPFLDGNGRVGRMLIPLFLHQKNYIVKPVFYMSEYFEDNRDEYYKKLQLISQNHEWNGWIEFFLKAICEQSDKNISKSKEIVDLYNDMKRVFAAVTHSEFAINILDILFKKPIISASELAKISGISLRTVNNILNKLLNNNILKLSEENMGSKSSIYSFTNLIKIV
jgi:Fic family protein